MRHDFCLVCGRPNGTAPRYCAECTFAGRHIEYEAREREKLRARAEKAEARARQACQTLIAAFGSIGPEDVEHAAERAAEAHARTRDRVTELEEAAKRVLDILVTRGHVDNHGHRRRGTGCDVCSAVYALADSCGYALTTLDGEPDVPSATASVRVADDASVEASIERIGRTHEGLIKALAQGEDGSETPVQRLASAVRRYIGTWHGKPPAEASCDDASVVAYEALLRVLDDMAPVTGSTEPKP